MICILSSSVRIIHPQSQSSENASFFCSAPFRGSRRLRTDRSMFGSWRWGEFLLSRHPNKFPTEPDMNICRRIPVPRPLVTTQGLAGPRLLCFAYPCLDLLLINVLRFTPIFQQFPQCGTQSAPPLWPVHIGRVT